MVLSKVHPSAINELFLNSLCYVHGQRKASDEINWKWFWTPLGNIIIISKFLAQDNDFPAFWMVP